MFGDVFRFFMRLFVCNSFGWCFLIKLTFADGPFSIAATSLAYLDVRNVVVSFIPYLKQRQRAEGLSTI